MIGTKGFRAREAAANYKRRDRRLVSEEVRAIRAAKLPGTSFHGVAETSEAPVKPATQVQPEQEVKTAETQVEQTAEGDNAADETDGEEAGDETDAGEADEGEEAGETAQEGGANVAADKPAKPKKKAAKAKK